MNGRKATLAALCGVIALMLTLVGFSVPLYRLFCEATGYDGTTQRVGADTAAISDRHVTVFFLTATDSHLPWKFAPVQDQCAGPAGAGNAGLLHRDQPLA